MSTLTVALLDSEDRYLTVEADFDAPGVSRFTRVTETKAFLAGIVGGTGYRVSDDCELVAETVAAFRVFEDGNDLTADFVALLAR